MKVTGQCHCRAIECEADIDPERVVICHCTDCQVMSGTAYRVIAFTHAGALKFTKGDPKIYTKTAESGNPRAQAFCDNCGSAIYASNTGDGPHSYGLRAGVIHQRAELKPKRQLWRRSALDWVNDLGTLPAVDKQA